MSIFKYKRSMEAFVQPTVSDVENPPAWMDAEEVKVRIPGGHELIVKTTKEGIEVQYQAPKNKKLLGVSSDATDAGASFKVKL